MSSAEGKSEREHTEGPHSHAEGWKSSIPFVHERIGAVAVYCSDGRYNEQFDEFLHKKLGLPRYDRLTLPGGAAPLAGHLVAHREEDALDIQLRFLIEAHQLDRVVLIAHHDCGFYKRRLGISGSDLRSQQEGDLLKAGTVIGRMGPVKVETYFAAVRDGRVVMEEV